VFWLEHVEQEATISQLDYPTKVKMFKHILIPTDGSATSIAAARKGISLAKTCGANVVGLYVVPEFHMLTYQMEMLEDTREQFEKHALVHAKKYLEEVGAIAKEAGVRCETLYVHGDSPYEEIVKVAHDKRCDLIAMASHGRKGAKGFLLGSETQKVLAHSEMPVLVFR
jgi:nucleotide-binding universal stress UspA family protein